MTKEQFITQLRRELKKLPPEEIVEATEYYEEYFAEAAEGEGLSEEQLIEQLGSPKKVAAQIKSEYASRVLTEDESTLKYKPTVGHKISAAWWILLGVLAAPVGIPVAIALASIIFALGTALFCTIIGLYAGLIGILAGGIAAVVLGFIAFGSAFSTAVMFLGAGLFLGAFAVLCGTGLTVLVKKLVLIPVNMAQNAKERKELE